MAPAQSFAGLLVADHLRQARMLVYTAGLVAQRGKIQHAPEQSRDAGQGVTPKVAGRLMAGAPLWPELSSTHRKLRLLRPAAACANRVTRSGKDPAFDPEGLDVLE